MKSERNCPLIESHLGILKSLHTTVPDPIPDKRWVARRQEMHSFSKPPSHRPGPKVITKCSKPIPEGTLFKAIFSEDRGRVYIFHFCLDIRAAWRYG
jgi:hypothetical protein